MDSGEAGAEDKDIGMMQAASVYRSTNRGATQDHPEYLDCLHELARELEAAMQSLAVNGLSSFKESVDRQVELCSRISSLAAEHNSRDTGDSDGVGFTNDGDFGSRIEDAKDKLLKLNRNYSALLNHTRRTVQMFAGLARCYSGYPNSAGISSPSRTWSSEI